MGAFLKEYLVIGYGDHVASYGTCTFLLIMNNNSSILFQRKALVYIPRAVPAPVHLELKGAAGFADLVLLPAGNGGFHLQSV